MTCSAMSTLTPSQRIDVAVEQYLPIGVNRIG